MLAVIGLTPPAIIVFLGAFLVTMASGGRTNGFVRLCQMAVWPSGLLVLLLVLLTLRYA